MPARLRSLATPSRVLLAALLATAAVIITFRFAFGLGSVTNLSDQTPWGIWVGFDILAGIGLAAGGFIMAAAVYVFGLERYRPLLRMSILTALIGYLLFITGLILEIGRPWNIWRCIVNHNFHSALFEIAWCVMLYTTVLLLEFSQVVWERLGWHRVEALLHRALIPLVSSGSCCRPSTSRPWEPSSPSSPTSSTPCGTRRSSRCTSSSAAWRPGSP